MKFKQYALLSLFIILGNIEAKDHTKSELCQDKKTCQIRFKKGKKACLCYCSVKCGPREKVKADKPVWIEDDPNGNYCYCKQWDFDAYKPNKCALKDQEAQQEEAEEAQAEEAQESEETQTTEQIQVSDEDAVSYAQ